MLERENFSEEQMQGAGTSALSPETEESESVTDVSEAKGLLQQFCAPSEAESTNEIGSKKSDRSNLELPKETVIAYQRAITEAEHVGDIIAFLASTGDRLETPYSTTPIDSVALATTLAILEGPNDPRLSEVPHAYGLRERVKELLSK
jgi:hypothetical protein